MIVFTESKLESPMRFHLLLFPGLFIVGAAVLACNITDDERCGNDFYYDENTESCMKNIHDDTAADDGIDTSEDAGADASRSAVPSGLGEYCRSDKDCEKYDTTYCAKSPFSEFSFCTITPCTTVPNSCPPNWTCCSFVDVFGFPDMCIPTEQYEGLGTTACVN